MVSIPRRFHGDCPQLHDIAARLWIEFYGTSFVDTTNEESREGTTRISVRRTGQSGIYDPVLDLRIDHETQEVTLRGRLGAWDGSQKELVDEPTTRFDVTRDLDQTIRRLSKSFLPRYRQALGDWIDRSLLACTG